MKIWNLAGGAVRIGLQGGQKAAQAAAAVGELAAKTLVTTAGGFARLTVSAGVAAAKGAAATPTGRRGLDVTLRYLKATLSSLPGTRASSLDADELRESFIATAADAGVAVAHETVSLAEAATSAALGDPTRLRREIQRALERMRLLAGAGDTLDILPGTPVPQELRDQARVMLDHAPDRLLEALNGGLPRDSSRAVAIFKAMIDDAGKLRVFSLGYPRVLASLGARVGGLLLTDSLTLAELDAFLAGRRFELRGPADRNGHGKCQPAADTETSLGSPTDRRELK